MVREMVGAPHWMKYHESVSLIPRFYTNFYTQELWIFESLDPIKEIMLTKIFQLRWKRDDGLRCWSLQASMIRAINVNLKRDRQSMNLFRFAAGNWEEKSHFIYRKLNRASNMYLSLIRTWWWNLWACPYRRHDAFYYLPANTVPSARCSKVCLASVLIHSWAIDDNDIRKINGKRVNGIVGNGWWGEVLKYYLGIISRVAPVVLS